MKIFSRETQRSSIPFINNISKTSVNKFKYLIPSIAFVSSAIAIFIYSPQSPPSLLDKFVQKSGSLLIPSSKEFIDGSIMYKSSLYTSFVNWTKSLATFNPKIVLDIPLEGYDELLKTKNQALEDGVLLDKGNWIKSSLRTSYSSTSIPIKLRLKGDWTDHLENGRWSFRIKTRKGTYYDGMKTFSIQPAVTRSYLFESLFHSFLKFEKLPHLRYNFVDLMINGTNQGVYAIEESFSKELIENSGFRESVILRSSESNLFANKLLERAQSSARTTSSPQVFSINDKLDFETSSLKSFNSSVIAQNESLTNLYSKAVNSFENFASKNQKAVNTFEYSKWAGFYAISDLFQSWHTRRWHNLRLYYNPITGKFIPIGFDASDTAFQYKHQNIPSFIDQYNENTSHNYLNLFSDYKFAEQYVREVSRIASKPNLDNFFSAFNKLFDSQLKVINSSFPFASSMENEIRSSAEVLLKSINPPPDPFKIKRYAKSQDSNPEILSLALNSNHYLPIEIISIKNNSITWVPVNGSYLPATNPKKLGAYTKFSFLKAKTVQMNNNIDLRDQTNFIVKFRTIGANEVKTQEFSVLSVHNPVTNGKLASATKNNLTNPYPSLFEFESKAKSLTFVDKNVSIDSTLYIPKGFYIKVAPGTTVAFKPGASLISYSPIVVEGEPSQRVLFKGTATSGLLIANAGSQSVIRNTDFQDFGIMNDPRSQVTGAITFYDSPVDIYNSSFIKNASEDALNIFRSSFLLDNVTFENSQSDALDVDFATGKILNSRFIDIGNDALDFSGSVVTIDKAAISNASDKVISAGERSTLYIKNVLSNNSSVGITSKDSSAIFAKNVEFNNVDVCLAAFNKKSFFKGGTITIDKAPVNCNIPYLVESSSSLSIDNKSVVVNATDVESLMYGRKFGKATQK